MSACVVHYFFSLFFSLGQNWQCLFLEDILIWNNMSLTRNQQSASVHMEIIVVRFWRYTLGGTTLCDFRGEMFVFCNKEVIIL